MLAQVFGHACLLALMLVVVELQRYVDLPALRSIPIHVQVHD